MPTHTVEQLLKAAVDRLDASAWTLWLDSAWAAQNLPIQAGTLTPLLRGAPVPLRRVRRPAGMGVSRC